MKVIELRDAFGIDNLKPAERQDAALRPGETRVRVRAASLNYRDLMTVKHGGGRGVQLPLIPLSDGAGEVVETGPGVSRVKPGDRVMGIFMQTWLAGEPTQAHAASALGGAVGRHAGGTRRSARERPRAHTRLPVRRGSRHPAVRRGHRLAGPDDEGRHAGRRHHSRARHRRGIDFCPAVRRHCGRQGHHYLQQRRQAGTRQRAWSGPLHQLPDHAGLGQERCWN